MHTATTVSRPGDEAPPIGPRPPDRSFWRPVWADLALIPLVVGIVAFVRRYALHAPLWGDEQMIASNIRDRGFADLAGALDYNQSAPLGWLWAQHALVAVFGTDEYVLRLLPLLAAIGTLVLGWLAGRRWLGPVGAVVLVGFLASNASLMRYSAEVKQYSGDLFWTMLLLIATMLLVERSRPTPRQYLLWWSVAALASLFSMGAMLATPVFAVVVVVTAWLRAGWRTGWREGLRAALPFLVWLAVFAAHYLLSLRYVVGSDRMVEFWGRLGYPPAGASVQGIAVWAWQRLDVLSADPIGLAPPGRGMGYIETVSPVFWLLVVLGCVAATWRRRPFGALLAGVVLSAYALAVAEIVPLSVRLAMWILPAVFLAVGFAADAAARLTLASVRAVARGTGRAVPVLARGLAGAAAVVAVSVLLGPLFVGRATEAPPTGAHDIRDAVGWAAGQHRPGDLTLVLSGSGHSILWYAAGTLTPRREVETIAAAGGSCPGVDLATIVAGHQRVIVYGYLKNAELRATAAQLRTDLEALGTVVAEHPSGPGIDLVVALRPPAERSPTTGCYRR